MKFLIERIDDSGIQTLGRLYVLDENNGIKYDCDTLELPWKNNDHNVSCIPEGEYMVMKRTSVKFKNHFHILNVKDRAFILIHPGNYFTDIRGCVLVGKDLKDINHDQQLDVTSSRNTMADLLGLMPNTFKLKIVKI
jgi:hypothetical protein